MNRVPVISVTAPTDSSMATDVAAAIAAALAVMVYVTVRLCEYFMTEASVRR